MGEVVVFRKRRGVELVMLILAMGLGVGAFVLTNLNLYEACPTGGGGAWARTSRSGWPPTW